MTGHARIEAHLNAQPVDSLPLMPITMMWAADQLGVPYGRYVQDYRILAEAQVLVAEKFDIDHVSVISDPAREVTDLGVRCGFIRINLRRSLNRALCWRTRVG